MPRLQIEAGFTLLIRGPPERRRLIGSARLLRASLFSRFAIALFLALLRHAGAPRISGQLRPVKRNTAASIDWSDPICAASRIPSGRERIACAGRLSSRPSGRGLYGGPNGAFFGSLGRNRRSRVMLREVRLTPFGSRLSSFITAHMQMRLRPARFLWQQQVTQSASLTEMRRKNKTALIRMRCRSVYIPYVPCRCGRGPERRLPLWQDARNTQRQNQSKILKP